MLHRSMTNHTSQRSLGLFLAATLLSVGLLVGCDESGGTAPESSATGSDNSGSDNSVEEASGEARFKKSLKDKPCDLLSMSMVATTIGVAEVELKQQSVGRTACAYRWEDSGEKLNAALTQPRVFKSEESAGRHFQKTTKNTDVTFEDVEGIGDEARVDTNSGSITVRVANLYFILSAHQDVPAKALAEAVVEGL